MNTVEKRLEELEIKLSYQQELVDSLNNTVTEQWETIDRLNKLTKRLREELLGLKENTVISSEMEAPPPHY